MPGRRLKRGCLGLLLGVACQPPIVLEDDDGMNGSTAGTVDGDPPPVVTSTTSVDPMTSDSSDPSVADTSTGEPPFPETCDVFAQDCPPGYKCTYFVGEGSFGYSGTRCVEVVDDPQAPLEPCSVPTWPPDGNDDCDATSFCYGMDPETMQGMCAAFCIGSPDDLQCADACQYCRVTADVELPCLPTCDPLVTSCPEGQGCYPIEDVFLCAPTAMRFGPGEPCEFINGCISGTACLAADVVPGCPGNACCTPICDPGAAFDPCPKILPGTECMPWYTPGERPLPSCSNDPPGVCVVP